MRWVLLIGLLLAIPAMAATPTLVQTTYAENSQGPGGTTWGTGSYYKVQFPEATLANNLLVCEAFGANTGLPTYSIADDKSNTWVKADSTNYPFTSASGNIYNIWYVAGATAGVRQITLSSSLSSIAASGFSDIKCQEFYNVATSSPRDGTSNCHTATTTTPSGVATGTLTTGDLVIQTTDNDNATTSASFTAGSQSNITWNLTAVDRLDGYAVQYGVYNATATFTPQLTAGTSRPYTSCNVQFKSAAAGTAPSQAFRIDALGHFAIPSTGTTNTVQFPSAGNLVIVSFTGGGDCIANSANNGCATTAATTSLSSSPSNTWNCTGTVAGNTSSGVTSQICYAAAASTATTMSISITRNVNGGALTQDTVLVYDVIGAATSPFDNDSGGQSAASGTLVTSLTTCSSCFSPLRTNDLVVANANWDFGTSTAITAPAAAFYDSAVTNWNQVNGPQAVDQNGGWAHYYTSSTSSISVTWTLANDGTNAPGHYAGRVAAFTPPLTGPPPGQFPRVQ